MNKTHRSIITLILLILTPLYSYAINCDDESPEKILLGDIEKYYNLNEGKPLSSDQKKKISALIKRFNRRLNGTATEEYCLLSEQKVVSISHEVFDGSLSLNNDGILRFNYDSRSNESNVHISDQVVFFEPLTSYKLLKVNDDSIIATSKLRSGTKKVLLERVMTISFQKRGIEIDLMTYANGYFGSRWFFKLKR